MKDNSKMGLSDSLIAAARAIMEKEHTVPKSPKEKASVAYRLDLEIESKNEEIAAVGSAIERLRRILDRPEPFTMGELLSALKVAKPLLQEEFVKLLGL